MEKTGLIDSFYSAGKSDSSVETRIRSRFSWPLNVFSGLSDSKDADLTSNAVFFELSKIKSPEVRYTLV